MGMLIVNRMLLTGFDAPEEQVLYLDQPMVAQNLLQTIARPNRVGREGKDKGYVVDYVGVGHHLREAISGYDEREQKEVEDALSFPEDELRDLQASHAAIMDLLRKHGLTDLTDHDAFYDVFYDEDLRFDYMLAFRKLTKCMNIVFPARQALDYWSDYQALTEINVLAGKHFRDERLSMKGIPPKLRAIADQYLTSKGIDQRVAPISIFDKEFEQEVAKRKRTKTKAAEVEHAIRHHIEVELDDDPDLQASFAEALALIFKNFQDNWKKIYEELEKLRQRIVNTAQEPTYGLHRKKQMPFFRTLKREIFDTIAENPVQTVVGGETAPPYGLSEDEQVSILVDLTQQVYLAIERELKLTNFWDNIPAQSRLRAEIQETLLRPAYAKLTSLIRNRRHIVSRLMETARKKNDIILFAE